MYDYERMVKLLRKYKIPIVNTVEVNKSLNKIKFPVVLKVYSRDLIHKTEAGAVITDIYNKRYLIKYYNKLRLKFPNSKIIIQEQLKGIELIVGYKKDKIGNLMMFGLGGIYTQIFKDISFRVCPVSKIEIKNMIKETKISKALYGSYRGIKYPTKKLESVLYNICKMCLKENLNELDLNPIIINQNGLFVVDFRIF